MSFGQKPKSILVRTENGLAAHENSAAFRPQTVEIAYVPALQRFTYLSTQSARL